MVTPIRLARTHLDTVLAQLPGAFDGDAESVHQARVATRRLREALSLLDGAVTKQAFDAVRTAGRHLGRVRELDVMSTLLDSIGRQIPSAAAGVAHEAYDAVIRRQRETRRDMVKALERLELSALQDVFAAEQADAGWRSRLPPYSRKWTKPLWTQIRSRSEDAVEAVRRAPGVYLPRRTHRARIAVKKLRYALEIAADTGIWQPERAVKDLRRIQTSLGNVHDAQVLLDMLDDLTPLSPDPSARIALTDALENEIERHHAEYRQQRDRVYQIADACGRAAAHADRWPRPHPLLAASMFTAPLIVESLAASRRIPHAPHRQVVRADTVRKRS